MLKQKIEELSRRSFTAIGHDPATQLFKNQLQMDKEGYLITKPTNRTNIRVYALGG